MTAQLPNKPIEDEISLREIVDFLLKSWKIIAFSGVVGGLLAAGYVLVTPPKYHASANIQVGKVAGVEVESPGVLVEKLKLPMYYSSKSYSACNVIDQIDPGKVIANNLNPRIAKLAPIVSFSYTDNSPEDAQKCLESVLRDIRSNQSSLAKPILESKNKELINLKKKLDAAERIITELPNKNSSFDFSDVKSSSSVLLLATILIKENEIKDLRSQINDLEIELLESQTGETFLVTPIYASQQKVSPKQSLLLKGGVVIGLFLGLLFMVGKRSWRT